MFIGVLAAEFKHKEEKYVILDFWWGLKKKLNQAIKKSEV